MLLVDMEHSTPPTRAQHRQLTILTYRIAADNGDLSPLQARMSCDAKLREIDMQYMQGLPLEPCLSQLQQLENALRLTGHQRLTPNSLLKRLQRKT